MSEFVLQKYMPDINRIVFGCMGLGGAWDKSAISDEHIKKANAVIDTALDSGINFFDHADIYTLGKAESVFGEVLKTRKDLREKMFIQSKCGIRFEDDLGPKRYDLSYSWIMSSVDGILSRLNIEYIDILLLHRPDSLMQSCEVARAFEELNVAGKVRHFGVSNMHAHQIDYLQDALDLPLIVNQMEIHLAQSRWLDEDLFAGSPQAHSKNYSPGLLSYCQKKSIQVQSWGSLSQGLYTGNEEELKRVSHASPSSQKAALETIALVNRLSEQHHCAPEAILLAWIMFHPSGIQPVIGTTNEKRIADCAQAVNVKLTKAQWYALYVAARGEELP